MRTTAILNLKGGVGKTTTAINMAAILSALHKKKVVIVDADAQHNTSDFFLPPEAAKGLRPLSNVTARMLRDEKDPGTLWSMTVDSGKNSYTVDILPSNDELMALDLTRAENNDLDLNWMKNFRFAKSGKSLSECFDFCIVDCPPAFNAATAAALIAADDVVIPMKLDAFSISGMVNLMQQVSNMRQINPALRVAGILPTMYYDTTTIRRAEEQLKMSGLHVFHHIRRSSTVDRMTFQQRTLIEAARTSSAREDYIRFAEEYLMQGGDGNGV